MMKLKPSQYCKVAQLVFQAESTLSRELTWANMVLGVGHSVKLISKQDLSAPTQTTIKSQNLLKCSQTGKPTGLQIQQTGTPHEIFKEA
jgi:hypothetical protein